MKNTKCYITVALTAGIQGDTALFAGSKNSLGQIIGFNAANTAHNKTAL